MPSLPERLSRVVDSDNRTYDSGQVEVVMLGSAIEREIGQAFDRWAGPLKGFAYAATRDVDAAEDIVQEAFLRLTRQLRANRAPDDVGAWLFRVASNLLASRGRHRSVVERAKFRLVDQRVASSPEDLVIDREYDRQLVMALHALPEEARLALLMAGSGASSGEIAETIHRSRSATRTAICRWRLKLREEITRAEARGR